MEEDARFLVPLKGGQKTSCFFDRRDNRGPLLRRARGARVLDVCSHIDVCALRGAISVSCIDVCRITREAAAARAEPQSGILSGA